MPAPIRRLTCSPWLGYNGRSRKYFLVADLRAAHGAFLGMAGDFQLLASPYEGDEIVYRNNDSVPAVWGTGTEDYYSAGYQWDYDAQRQLAFHGNIHHAGVINAPYRWNVTDPIPFHSQYRMVFEMGGWNQIQCNYVTMAYFTMTRERWQVQDATGDSMSLANEDLHVVGRGLNPGSTLQAVTLAGSNLTISSGSSTVGSDSVLDIHVTALAIDTSGSLPLIAVMTSGPDTIRASWLHYSHPLLSFTRNRPDADSFAYQGDTLSITFRPIIVGASANIYVDGVMCPWVGTAPVADAQGVLRGRVTISPRLLPGTYHPYAYYQGTDSPPSPQQLVIKSFFRMEIEDMNHGENSGMLWVFGWAPDHQPGQSDPHWGRNLTRVMTGTGVGSWQEYYFALPYAGDYRPQLFLGKSPDAGILRVDLDGVPIISSYDGYHAASGGWTWFRSDTISCSPRTLAVGMHTLHFEIIGRYAASSGWVGIFDQMILQPLTSPGSPYVLPQPVTSVVASWSDQGITLVWNRVTSDTGGRPLTPDHYAIYRADYSPNGVFYYVGEVDGNDSTFLDAEPTHDGPPRGAYMVTALAGNSAPPAVLTVKLSPSARLAAIKRRI